MRRFLVTVDAGLETVTEDELRELAPGSRVRRWPDGVDGRLLVETVDPAPLLALRTAHHVDELRASGEIRSLDDLREIVARAELAELRDAASFRVTSSIRGAASPGDDRVALQRAAGGVLCERYGTPVDLERYELEIRVDLLGGTLVVGPRLDRTPLADRIRRGRPVRSSLKATTAAALLRLVGAQRGTGPLIDPLCGAGTIPLEAYRLNPARPIVATDWDAPTVEIARGTFANHGVPLDATLADARTLGERSPGAFELIVTDPPYGMRQGRRASLGELYRRLLRSFADALAPGGRIGVVVVKHRLFAAAVEASGLEVRRRVDVDAGAVRLRLFVLSRAS